MIRLLTIILKPVFVVISLILKTIFTNPNILDGLLAGYILTQLLSNRYNIAGNGYWILFATITICIIFNTFYIRPVYIVAGIFGTVIIGLAAWLISGLSLMAAIIAVVIWLVIRIVAYDKRSTD